jgi:peptide/nickel transport system ATP-binding protein
MAETASVLHHAEQSSGRDALLAVQGLHTWFELRKWGFIRTGWVRAVDNVDFSLARGEAIAIVGESGCGKSSLAKTILGLHRPTRGTIYLNGRRISDLSGREGEWYKSQIGYVMQDPYGALPPFMSIRKLLEEPLLIHGVKDPDERHARIVEAMTQMKMTPVDDFLTKFPHMLSGGQQQRIVIARAIILKPKLIVADEPVSMLDASVRVEILQLLRGLQRDMNIGLIYITHDLSTVRYFSERIFVMYAGRLVEEAEVDDLLDNPKHPYTRALLEAIADPDAGNASTFRKVPGGEPPSLANPPTGCRFHPRCSVMIKGLCNVEDPPRFEPSTEHKTLCWLYREETGE